MEKLTLEHLKNKLPLGMGAAERADFSFQKWGFEEEKKIGELKKQSSRMGPFVSSVLALMLKNLGKHDFSSSAFELPQKLLVLNQMRMMDVLYMYIYLRYDQLDDQVRLDVGCPSCGKVNKDFVASLNGLDVNCLGKDEKVDAIIDYKLRKPFQIGNDLIEVIKVKRTLWDAMEKTTDEISSNSGALMQLIFEHSIAGVNDEVGYVDHEKLLEGMLKIDIERLSKVITKHNGGPMLILEGKCKFCGAPFYKQLDWSYDSFFGSSSLPQD
jgi:hypothetical protein